MTPDDRRLFYVLESVAATPRHGSTAFVNQWWSVHPAKGLIFYRYPGGTFHPQCNQSEAVSRTVTSRLYPWADVRQVPIVYVPLGNNGDSYELPSNGPANE